MITWVVMTEKSNISKCWIADCEKREKFSIVFTSLNVARNIHWIIHRISLNEDSLDLLAFERTIDQIYL